LHHLASAVSFTVVAFFRRLHKCFAYVALGVETGLYADVLMSLFTCSRAGRCGVYKGCSRAVGVWVVSIVPWVRTIGSWGIGQMWGHRRRQYRAT